LLRASGRNGRRIWRTGNRCGLAAADRPDRNGIRAYGYAQALAWFEAEHQVLVAAVALAEGSGFDVHAWQLPWAIASFLQTRGHYQDWAATQRTALAAATRLGHTAGQALSGRLLAAACACSYFGDHDQARSHYASSLRLCQQLGNRFGEAKVQHHLGLLAGRQGRNTDALGHADQALRLYHAMGDQANEVAAINAVGWYHGLLGDYQQARAFCGQALIRCAEAGYRLLEGHAWDSKGYAEQHLGNLAEAGACYQRALILHEESGDRFGEAATLTRPGNQGVTSRRAWRGYRAASAAVAASRIRR
jgi:tetratricopeptide (TPR) repeat protein